MRTVRCVLPPSAYYDIIDVKVEAGSSVLRACRLLCQDVGFKGDTDLWVNRIRAKYIRYKKKLAKKNPRHGNMIGTVVQEALLVGVARSFSLAGSPLDRGQMLTAASEVFGHQVGAKWLFFYFYFYLIILFSFFKFLYRYHRFIDQYSSEIIDSSRKLTSSKRLGPLTRKNTDVFIQIFGSLVPFINRDGSNLWNADESLISVHQGKLRLHRVHAKGSKTGAKKQGTLRTAGSMTPFVNALGDLALLVYCMKAEEGKEVELEVPIPVNRPRTRSTGQLVEYLYLFTHSGYMNKTTWGLALEKFAQIIKRRTPGLLNYLLSDNLRFHRKPEAMRVALKLNIYQVFFAPNKSQSDQPLDDLPFAIYKTQLSLDASRERWTKIIENQNHRHLLMQITRHSEEIAFTSKHIREGFDNCGIWPFSPEKMYENMCKDYGEEDVEMGEGEKEVLSIRQEAERVTAAILDSTPSISSKTRRVTIATIYGEAFDTDSILRRHDQELAEKEKKDQEKQEKKAREEKEKEVRKKDREEKKKLRDALKKIQKKKKEERRIQSEWKKQEEKKNTEERLEKQKNHTCRFRGCDHVWKSSAKWIWCDFCDAYGLCSSHRHHLKSLGAHERRCKSKQ